MQPRATSSWALPAATLAIITLGGSGCAPAPSTAGGAEDAGLDGGGTRTDGGVVGKVPLYHACACDQQALYYSEVTRGVTCGADNTCQGPRLPTSGNSLRCVSGACSQTCEYDRDCPGGVCANVDFSQTYCYLPCTLLPDSCPTGFACTVVADTTNNPPRSLTVCELQGAAPRGTDCIWDALSPLSLCEPWCRLDKPSDCASGTTCIAVSPGVSSGGSTYGTCRTDCDLTKGCADGRDCVAEAAPSGSFYTDCVNMSSFARAPACAVDTDCEAGAACVSHPPNAGATCEAYCVLPGACAAGSTCQPFAKPRVVRGVSYGACAVTCDPLSPTSCAAGLGCLIEGAHTDCGVAGVDVGPSAGCACVPGAQCTVVPVGPTSALEACEAYCRPDDPASCPSGFRCMSLVPPETVGGIAYGVCQDVCNLATPYDVCGANATCLLVNDGTNPLHTTCVGLPGPPCVEMSAGTDANGDPISVCVPQPPPTLGAQCTDDSMCPAGATCQSGTCVGWCDLTGATHCPGGTTCHPLSPSATVDGVTYGVCTP